MPVWIPAALGRARQAYADDRNAALCGDGKPTKVMRVRLSGHEDYPPFVIPANAGIQNGART